MTFDDIVNHLVEEQPERFQHNNIKFLRRKNGEYLAALMDYDEQAKVVGDELIVVFCKASRAGIKSALDRIVHMGGII